VWTSCCSFIFFTAPEPQTDKYYITTTSKSRSSESEWVGASEYNSLLRPIKGNPTPSGCLYLLLGVHTCRRSTPRLVLEEEYRPSSSFYFYLIIKKIWIKLKIHLKKHLNITVSERPALVFKYIFLYGKGRPKEPKATARIKPKRKTKEQTAFWGLRHVLITSPSLLAGWIH